jgi:transcriptional regulator with XRE-family HTH domain
MAIDYKDIGFRIGERRRFLRMKQKDLADKMQISSKYLSNLENAHRRVTLEMLVDFSEKLGVTPDYFLLGNFRKDTCSNIVDNLKLCSPEDQEMISELVKICAHRNQNNKHDI